MKVIFIYIHMYMHIRIQQMNMQLEAHRGPFMEDGILNGAPRHFNVGLGGVGFLCF